MSDNPARPSDAVGSNLYRNVLDSVPSGILALDLEGRIILFNEAAVRLTGLSADALQGRLFSEAFAQLQEAEEFVDIVFDTIHDVGQTRVVEVAFQGKSFPLSIRTEHLTEERDGEIRRVGLIVMFYDLTGVAEQREEELRLAKEAHLKNVELSDAYRTLEAGHQRLQDRLKGKYVRYAKTILVVFIFAFIAWYSWDTGPGPGTFVRQGDGTDAGNAENRSVWVVAPQPLSSAVTVTGRLEPRQEVEVTSPIKGKVIAIHFAYGERVRKGQKLVELDVSEVEIQRHKARVDYIRAKERVDDLEHWDDHVDVARTRRNLMQAQIAAETSKNKQEQAAFLLERGIIPTTEFKAAKREHEQREMSLQEAEQDLQIILAQGGKDLQVAAIELSSAKARLDSLEEIIRKAEVLAPVSGVAFRSGTAAGDSAEGDRGLVAGAFVNHGQQLLTIGNLDGLTVVGQVDEVDVVKIQPGNPAIIVGDAFPDLRLAGEITRVSSQATKGEGNVPSYEVTAVVETLPEDQRETLRLGMSARLEVVVYEREDALLVPFHAVHFRDGQSWVRVRDPVSGQARDVRVKPGVTTLDAVEILEGVEAGSEIFVPRS